VLSSSLSQQERFKGEIDKLKAEQAETTGQQKYQIKRAKEAITKLREELAELTTSSDDFHNDIESGKKKQALHQDQLDEMKQHCEQMEETVSLKIIKLKDLREKLADAELEAHQTEEQLTKLTRTGRQPLNKSSKG
jgi:chromosome segregation ATPase